MRPRPRATRRAFTVIELVLVVVFMGIIGAIAIPRLRVSKYRADGAARLVLTLLGSAQRNSITRQSNVIVSVDLTNQRVRIVEDYNNNDTLNTSDRVTFRRLPEGARFVTPPMGRVFGGTATAAIQGSNLRTVSSMEGVIFRRDGTASSDAELYLTARAEDLTEYRAVVVNPATGRVEWYRWGGAAWRRVVQ